MPRELKLWNGRGQSLRRSWADCSVAIAAYSREDARRVVEEVTGRKPPVSELRDYFSQCWGRNMDGITPERGIWIQRNIRSKPERVTQ